MRRLDETLMAMNLQTWLEYLWGWLMRSDIEKIFYEGDHPICQKWAHYFEIYEENFSFIRGRACTFMEIGVSQGGSVSMWKQYFGPQARIIGVDINPDATRFADDQVEIVIGDQEDIEFLRNIASQYGPFDAVLDDGGHTMIQQINTFKEIYPFVKEGGAYLCEDVHTSYHAEFGGGLMRSDSFIEFMKAAIDDLHSWYHAPAVQENSLARTTKSICFYDSIVALRKKAFSGPQYVEAGR